MKRDAFIPRASGLALGLSALTQRAVIFKHEPKAMVIRGSGKREVIGA